MTKIITHISGVLMINTPTQYFIYGNFTKMGTNNLTMKPHYSIVKIA